MPMMKELIAKAESLACNGRMPMISAAMSMSRVAIHIRPMRPRTRFFAASAVSVSSPRDNKYRPAGLSKDRPRMRSGGAETDPDDA